MIEVYKLNYLFINRDNNVFFKDIIERVIYFLLNYLKIKNLEFLSRNKTDFNDKLVKRKYKILRN